MTLLSCFAQKGGTESLECSGASESSESSSHFLLALMEQVFSNPLILQQILKSPALRPTRTRRVSRLWNEVTLSLAIPRLILHVNLATVGACCAKLPLTNFLTTPFFSPKVTRALKISRGCMDTPDSPLPTAGPHSSDIIAATAAVALSTVSTLFPDYVTEITIRSRLTILHTLHQLLFVGLPNIKSLTINCLQRVCAATDPAPTEPFESQLPAKVKLTHLDFNIDFPPQTFMQHVVSAAPNLESLSLEGNVYLDLAANRHLVRLVFNGRSYFNERGSRTPFDPILLGGMISQVAPNLEYLILKMDTMKGRFPMMCTSLVLPPVMPNLKSFTNRAVDVYSCVDGLGGLRNLTGGNMTLAGIRIGTTVAEPDGVDKLVDKLFNGSVPPAMFRDVTNLVIWDVTDYRLLRNLNQTFPGLVEADISFGMRNDGVGSSCKNHNVFGDTMKIFLQHGGLFKLTVSFSLYLKLSDVVKGLTENKNLLKSTGLQHVKIMRDAKTDIVDDLDQAQRHRRFGISNYHTELEKVLLCTRGMSSFVICGVMLQKTTSDRIYKYVEHKSLPVKLYDMAALEGMKKF